MLIQMKTKLKKSRVKDLTNKRFSFLLVLDKYIIERKIIPCGAKVSYAKWLCKCDCGTIKYVKSSYLVSGEVRSCGCYNPIRLKSGESAFRKLYRQYERHSQERGLIFNLTKEEFKYLTQQNCYYCNITPQTISNPGQGCSTGDYLYNGVDRINNDIGYIIENCVPCCTACNSMKGTMFKDEFFRKIQNIYLNRIINNE